MEKHGTYFNLYIKQQKYYKLSELDLKLDSISEIPECNDSFENEDGEYGDDDHVDEVGLINKGFVSEDEEQLSDLVSPADVIKEISESSEKGER